MVEVSTDSSRGRANDRTVADILRAEQDKVVNQQIGRISRSSRSGNNSP
jgi:hypothetical protein